MSELNLTQTICNHEIIKIIGISIQAIQTNILEYKEQDIYLSFDVVCYALGR